MKENNCLPESEANSESQLAVVRRVAQLVRDGECVLFLGAGISIESGAPSGPRLAQELATEYFDDDSSNYALDEVCDLIDSNYSRRDLNRWLSTRLKPLRPAGGILRIPEFQWRAIYTTNFDGLLEASYREAANRAQQLHPIYSNRDPLNWAKADEVLFYKLHGCLTRANSDDGRLVLTQADFARVEDSRKRLFNRLFDEVSDLSVLYVGFGRRDPDFTRILVDVEKAAGGFAELRWSYALQPGFQDADRVRWESKRITLIDLTANKFFELLAREVEQLGPPSLGMIGDVPAISLVTRYEDVSVQAVQDVEQHFEIVDERIGDEPPNTDEFFRGDQPNWGVISENVDAPRDIADQILEAVLVDSHLDVQRAFFFLVHAEAGTGKSTLLRRLAADLSLIWDKIVVFLKPYGELDFGSLERLAHLANERVYVFIDDATDHARDISRLLTAANRSNSRISVLAGARTNEWRESQESVSLSTAEEFELAPLSHEEIEALIDTLEKHDALGYLTGAPRQSIIDAFESRANKQLLVALREATEGKNFDEIVVDEFHGIPTLEGQRAYLYVSALHRLGIMTRTSLLRRVLNIPFTELAQRVFEPTTKVIVPRHVLGEEEQYYAARHPLISEIVFDRQCQSERRRLEIYGDIIRNLDLGYASDLAAYRKMTRGHNRKLMIGFDDIASRREVMNALIRLDPSDATAHQHAAMMELRAGALDLASQHIANAKRLFPDSHVIRDTEGRIALRRGVEESNPVLADRAFKTAEEIFERNIARAGYEPYGYRHLAETYVEWSERQSEPTKKLGLIARAYETLLEGLDTSDSTAMLFQKLGELEEQIGNIAEAREAFREAIAERPADAITRLMLAKLEERDGNYETALHVLEDGLEISPYDSELHLRIALLKDRLSPAKSAEIRSHFRAAILGPLRKYRARLAYASYLFANGDYDESGKMFRELDELMVSSRERFEPRSFDFTALKSEYVGRIAHVFRGGGWIEHDQGATTVYFSSKVDMGRLRVGQQVQYELRFNLKGPVAVGVSLI